MDAINDLQFKKFSLVTNCRSKSFPISSCQKAYYESINPEVATYTSFKDLIPLTTQGGSPKSCSSADDIPVTNLLVKKAAWAYLQPIPKILPANSLSWCRIWDILLKAPMKACVNFFRNRIVLKVTRAFDKVRRAINISRFDN